MGAEKCGFGRVVVMHGGGSAGEWLTMEIWWCVRAGFRGCAVVIVLMETDRHHALSVWLAWLQGVAVVSRRRVVGCDGNGWVPGGTWGLNGGAGGIG